MNHFHLSQNGYGWGGKVLIRMLSCVNPEEYDINVILTKAGGELESEIPDYVKVEYCTVSSPVEDLKKIKIPSFVKGLYYRIRIRTAKTYEEKSYHNRDEMTKFYSWLNQN